jgi:hypothetical protein
MKKNEHFSNPSEVALYVQTSRLKSWSQYVSIRRRADSVRTYGVVVPNRSWSIHAFIELAYTFQTVPEKNIGRVSDNENCHSSYQGYVRCHDCD